MTIAEFLAKLDLEGVRADIRSLLGRVTKATDTPLDDLMAPYVLDAVWEFVKPKPKLSEGSPTSAFSGQTFAAVEAVEEDGDRYTEGEIREKLRARGYGSSVISMIFIAILLRVVKAVADRLIDKWFPAQFPGAVV